MLKTINDIKNYQNNLKPFNNKYITYYFNTIYQNLLMREETPNSDINEFNNRSSTFSNNKHKTSEKGISFRIFCQFFDIQEFICERIFKYLDKSKSNKLNKNEFSNGLYTIFFGNLVDLYKFTFSLCDFNENNKIHKMNMQIILSYIPVKTSEEQFEYIRHIKTVFNHYFTYLDKKHKDKNIGIEKEIDFELYQKHIEDFIEEEDNKKEEYKNNGSLLLFTSLMSYIYKHHPFLPENMNNCEHLKNKFLLKNIQNRYKLFATEKENNDRNERYDKFAITTIDKNNTKNNFKELGTKKPERQKSIVKEKDNDKDNLILPKIDLFHSSKRSVSLFTTKNKNIKNSKLKINTKISEEDNKLIGLKNNNIQINRNLKENRVNNLLKSFQFPEHKLANTFKNRMNNKMEIDIFNISPTKTKNIKFSLYNETNNNDEEDLIKPESENNIHQVNDDYSDLLYKYCDEDNSKVIKKYYAIIQGKDILFFSSRTKNELLVIWNINRAIIKLGDKTDVSKYTFYPIKFIYNNGSYSIIYFLDQEKQIKFAKKLEENINYIKIEDKYEIKDKIGQGHFGVVKKCIEKSTGKEYAVKIMNKTKLKEKDLQLVIKERNYISLIKHPNIVSLIQDYEDETYIYFVMDYFKGGDLAKYLSNIEKDGKNLEKISAKIIKIIAQGVQYLNNFGIVHRDLKPENIIFEKENDIKSIKIIDLGVAITLPYGNHATDPIGTLDYIAPEIFLHKPYCHKVDVWSIGILLYYLATGGILPFDDGKSDDNTVGKRIVFTHQEYPDNLFGDKNKSLICLIDKALEKSPEKRISINEFLKEEWLIKNSK